MKSTSHLRTKYVAILLVEGRKSHQKNHLKRGKICQQNICDGSLCMLPYTAIERYTGYPSWMVYRE